MTSDPLAELLAHLTRDGAVPLAWVAECAPDGDLRSAWGECRDAKVLVRLAGVVTARRSLVLAVCTTLRDALVRSGLEVPPVRATIEVAERWARGEAPVEDVRAAARAARAFSDATDAEATADEAREATVAAMVNAAAAAARVGQIAVVDSGELAKTTATAVHQAAACAAFALTTRGPSTERWHREHTGLLEHFAPLVRAHVSCPTLDQVLAAYRAR